MTPGAQLLIAKEGSVIYQKSYGYHTYDNNKKVANGDIYDLASLTKILVSVPLIIKEFETNNLNLDTKLGTTFSKYDFFIFGKNILFFSLLDLVSGFFFATIAPVSLRLFS